MVTLDAIKNLINPRKNKILDIAQSSLSESQFNAFRKLLLAELGKSGLESDLERLFSEHATRTGKARQGQE